MKRCVIISKKKLKKMVGCKKELLSFIVISSFLLFVSCKNKITLIGKDSSGESYEYDIPSSSFSSSSSFTSSDDLQAMHYIDTYKGIEEYCQHISSSTSSNSNNCKRSLLAELLKLLSTKFDYESPWLIDLVARYSFTRDIVEAVCNSNLGKRFNTNKKCIEKVTNQVRTKKTWLSQYDVLSLNNKVLNNDLIPLENWKGIIEGHSFLYYDKIRTFSELADDPRVSTICEIGFNFGHSVSI